MTENEQFENTALVSKSKSRLLPVPSLSSILSIAVIIFLIYAFFSRLTLQFYASFLFLFYSATKRMWISVMMLGIFQTLIMIPFRITNLLKSANLEEFKRTVEKIKIEDEQQYFLKKKMNKGGKMALYYVVNFFFATISYTSIGRLFLTDFYNTPLDPKLLYSFVPYPDYPILDRIFKLPYTWFTETRDFGWTAVMWAWGILLLIQAGIYIAVYFSKKKKAMSSEKMKRVSKITMGNLVLFLVLSWILIRHFPTGWTFRIFSGDVSIPNKTLNGITAIATFFTLIWSNLPKIRKKISMAREAGYSELVVKRTEKELFVENLKVASVVGLGAFYITNLIPSAFELSIFTLEIISWTAPLTLDKVILQGVGRMKGVKNDKQPPEDEDKEKEDSDHKDEKVKTDIEEEKKKE